MRSRFIPFFIILFALCSFVGLASGVRAAPETARSVSEHGITWTFSEEHTVGRFVNGEWWVVGPVTIVEIDPFASLVEGRNVSGSMVNPVNPGLGKAKQGLEERGRPGGHYRDSLNVAKQLPLTLSGNSSILSVGHQPDMSNTKLYLRTAAVLTVLDRVPPPGSFRPPYCGVEKPLFNLSQLNLDVFRKLPRTGAAPDIIAMAKGNITRVRVDLLGVGGAQANSELCYPEANNYGRELARIHNSAALALNLDYPDSAKRDLLIPLVQRGIDIHGAIKAGFSWHADGGHRSGRKVALYVAGKALGDNGILHFVNTDAYRSEAVGGVTIPDYDRFQEGQQHFIVSDLDIATPAYEESQRGMPEWKHRATTSDRKSQTSPVPWNEGYRRMNGSVNTSVVLIMTLMGDRKIWNDEAMFRYIIERFWPLEKGSIGGTNGIDRLTHEMWSAYFDTASAKSPVRPSRPRNLRPVE
jgi:hypothetical protein